MDYFKYIDKKQNIKYHNRTFKPFKSSYMNPKNQFFPLDGELFSQKLSIKIKEKRHQRKVRQQDMAHALGLSISTIKRIEQGEISVEYGSVIKVLWYLNLLEELLPDLYQSSPAPNKRVRFKSYSESDF